MASKRRFCAYLSGGMEYALREGVDWRRDMESWLRSELGHAAFNPNSASDAFFKRRGVERVFRQLKTDDPPRYQKLVREIVDRDSRVVADRADYVICLWDRAAARGAGTKGELTLARFFRKPVFLVTRIPEEKIPGWVLGCVTRQFRDFSALRLHLLSQFNSQGDSHGRKLFTTDIPSNGCRSRKRCPA